MFKMHSFSTLSGILAEDQTTVVFFTKRSNHCLRYRPALCRAFCAARQGVILADPAFQRPVSVVLPRGAVGIARGGVSGDPASFGVGSSQGFLED